MQQEEKERKEERSNDNHSFARPLREREKESCCRAPSWKNTQQTAGDLCWSRVESSGAVLSRPVLSSSALAQAHGIHFLSFFLLNPQTIIIYPPLCYAGMAMRMVNGRYSI